MAKTKRFKKTITIRLTEEEHALLESLCQLLKTSQSAYLTKQATEHVKKNLLEFAVEKYLTGQASFSELATQTGLSVPIIMDAVAEKSGSDMQCIEALLSAVKTLSEANNDPEFYELALTAFVKK